MFRIQSDEQNHGLQELALKSSKTPGTEKHSMFSKAVLENVDKLYGMSLWTRVVRLIYWAPSKARYLGGGGRGMILFGTVFWDQNFSILRERNVLKLTFLLEVLEYRMLEV